MHQDDLHAWTSLNLLPGLGPLARRRALERFHDPKTIAYRLPQRAFFEIGVRAKEVGKILDARPDLARRADRELRRVEKMGLRLLAFGDADYPAALQDLPDAPILIYMLGELPRAVVRVAVVGSRQATAYGRRVAAGMAGGLAARGVEVVSGGARGIDTCAHMGALENDGRTIAVIGSGLANAYPRENAALFERISRQGAVLSEFPLDFGPLPANFLRRNRLISGLAAAVVVVEAARRSGSLSTANHALDQGREVLAVPGPVSSSRSEGCNRLIQQGAKLVQNLDDILQELSPMYTSALPETEIETGVRKGSDPALTDDERAVAELLDEVEPTQLDELADRAPFGIARLLSALFGLEVAGAVETLPGRHYRSRGDREKPHK